ADAGKMGAPQGEAHLCGVSLGEEITVIYTHDTTIQAVTPTDAKFPNYKNVIPKDQPIAEMFVVDYEHSPGSLTRLIELLTFARDFNPRGVIKISAHENGMLWIDCKPN